MPSSYLLRGLRKRCGTEIRNTYTDNVDLRQAQLKHSKRSELLHAAHERLVVYTANTMFAPALADRDRAHLAHRMPERRWVLRRPHGQMH